MRRASVRAHRTPISRTHLPSLRTDTAEIIDEAGSGEISRRVGGPRSRSGTGFPKWRWGKTNAHSSTSRARMPIPRLGFQQ